MREEEKKSGNAPATAPACVNLGSGATLTVRDGVVVGSTTPLAVFVDAQAYRATECGGIDDIIGYHSPSLNGVLKIGEIRKAAKSLIEAIFINCPNCTDRSHAIRKVREAMMTANASIVLEGRSI